MRIADRISRLGTETAFAVSRQAAAFADEGNRVFSFHLGDMNLPTPATVVEGAAKAIAEGKTGYCPNAGIPELREAIAADVSTSHNTEYTIDNVAVQPGGKPTIGKFLAAAMNPGRWASPQIVEGSVMRLRFFLILGCGVLSRSRWVISCRWWNASFAGCRSRRSIGRRQGGLQPGLRRCASRAVRAQGSRRTIPPASCRAPTRPVPSTG